MFGLKTNTSFSILFSVCVLMETTKKYCIMLGFHQGLMLIASMLVKGRRRRVYSQNPLSCKLWVLTPASLYKTLVFLIFHHKGQKCRPQHSMLYPVLKSLAHRMNSTNQRTVILSLKKKTTWSSTYLFERWNHVEWARGPFRNKSVESSQDSRIDVKSFISAKW